MQITTPISFIDTKEHKLTELIFKELKSGRKNT